MNINDTLRRLKKRGFRLEMSHGSKGKLYPPEANKPFYSIHISGNEKTFFPLARFAKKEWGLDLNNI